MADLYILYELMCDYDCGEGSFYMCVDFSEGSKCTKLTFTATGLKTGTTYYFKVYAMRKLDTGNYVSDPSAIRKAKIK